MHRGIRINKLFETLEINNYEKIFVFCKDKDEWNNVEVVLFKGINSNNTFEISMSIEAILLKVIYNCSEIQLFKVFEIDKLIDYIVLK